MSTDSVGLAISVGVDVAGAEEGDISEEKLGMNLSVDVVGLMGPEGAMVAGDYYLIDTFYPGGTNGYATALGQEAIDSGYAFQFATSPY